MGGKNCPQIYQALKGRIYEMSIHKFASNVIEKCILNGTDEQKAEMINELLNKGDNVHDSLISLVKDKFGNYVVQKMIEHAPENSRKAVVEHIMNNSELRKKKDVFAKHVINFIEKKGYAVNISNNSGINNDININNMNNFNQEMVMNNMNMINSDFMNENNNNNLEYNNLLLGNNNLPNEFQYMNNNNNDINNMQIPNNLGINNNMNAFNFQQGQDNFDQNE